MQNHCVSQNGRLLAAALMLALPGPLLATPADEPVRIEITRSDVRAANEEAAAAYSALVSMWTRELRAVGRRFVAPRFVRYRGDTQTQCGVMPASNASYCFNNNTIYYDEVFLAVETKRTGVALRTDGDMAAVGIIAHEMGHAVAMQLGYLSRTSYQNESVADCLAGAFARQAGEDGSLEDGDVDEAFYAMAAYGDPELRPTGNRRLDRRRAAVLARQGHGTREQRMANFRAGLRGGGGACLDALR
jgi:predicted metalloprotease